MGCMTVTLSPHLSVKEARTLSVSDLSAEEQEFVQAVHGGGHVFASGKKTTDADNALVGTRSNERVVPQGGSVARRLTRAGWFRYAAGPTGDCGYFWLTESAERVMRFGRRS